MIIRLKVETGFDTRQVRRLFLRFKHLDRSNKGYLEKSDLLVLKEVSEKRPWTRNFLAFSLNFSFHFNRST